MTTSERQEHLDEVRTTFVSGLYQLTGCRESDRRVLVVALAHDDDELEQLVEEVADQQLRRPYLKPVFLVGAANTAPITRYRMQFETVVTHDRWSELGLGGSYNEYLQRRIQETNQLYAADTVLIPDARSRQQPWAWP